MASKLSIDEAKAYSVATFYENFSFEPKGKYIIKVCNGTACHVCKSVSILERLYSELGLSKEKATTDDRMCELVGEHPDVEIHFGPEIAHGDGEIGVKKSGCHGFCEMGPLVRIEPHGILYTKVKLEDCEEIFHRTIENGEPIRHLLFKRDGIEYQKQEDIPFYKKQTRNVLKNCEHIDAEHIEEYLSIGGYEALEKALFDMKPEEVISEISESNLRGREGRGFPTGYKWSQVAGQKEKIRYVVCNGDEGDPGAFMDRSIMEGDPHKMIEGIMIAAYAVGAQEGYIYVRAEYLLAISRLKRAIEQAEEYGLLGDHILGTDFSFHLHINKGAGAFVCGEGSALTASIEGRRSACADRSEDEESQSGRTE